MGLVSATGCATSQLLVESNPPGAEVYFVGFGNSVQQLGVTPMTLSPLTVPGLYKEQVQISVSKPGYHGESFLIPPSTGATLGKISARLNTDPLSKSCQEGVAAMIDATESVAQIQRLIFKKEFTEAERLLGPLTLKYPAVPVFHSLLGNVFYLQKNLTRALESYQRASELGPQNQETLKMIERIKAIKGGGG
ncbi:MAG: hypothetical protein ACK5QT_11215 [Oligoflexia bacterium]